jgi:hypothetical protein
MRILRFTPWGVLLCLLVSCKLNGSKDGALSADEKVAEDIISRMAKGFQNSVFLSEMVPFEWDTVYAIYPNMHPLEVEELKKNGSWAEDHWQVLKKEAALYLVFTQEGRVVRVANLPPDRRYLFEDGEGYTKIPRSAALMTSEVVLAPRSNDFYVIGIGSGFK